MLLMFIAVGAGLGLLLSHNAEQLILLQRLGALYLLYLGIQIWREANDSF